MFTMKETAVLSKLGGGHIVFSFTTPWSSEGGFTLALCGTSTFKDVNKALIAFRYSITVLLSQMLDTKSYQGDFTSEWMLTVIYLFTLFLYLESGSLCEPLLCRELLNMSHRHLPTCQRLLWGCSLARRCFELRANISVQTCSWGQFCCNMLMSSRHVYSILDVIVAR